MVTTSLMGLPPADEWPTSCSLPRSSFKDVPKQPLRNHIPNIDVQAAQLLEVYNLWNLCYLSVRFVCT